MLASALCPSGTQGRGAAREVCWRGRVQRRGRQGLWKPKEARDNIEGMVMLVLSRKKNESIVINNDITIVVVEIRGDKVRLGVEAPKEVPVHRREVYDAIRRNEIGNRRQEPAAYVKPIHQRQPGESDSSLAIGLARLQPWFLCFLS